jgi:hypothetical protein
MGIEMISKKFKIAIGLVMLVSLCLGFGQALARQNVTNWYVQNFDSQIVVNKDSSLDITEKITADCGQAVGKHGIFRILPEQINLATGETIKTPVKLLSITDLSGQPLKYTSSENSNDTVTWKIGDPDKTVQGVNYYQIHYLVGNAIRFGNPDFDELYWNLSGNFWDLEIDKFHADITFPSEVNSSKSAVEYYTGGLGSKSKSLANFYWKTPNILAFDSTGTLALGQGITASVTFPKNIFTPYQPGFWEKYAMLFFAAIPIVVFLICFYFWWKYGRDPKVKKTVIAEYEAPGDLAPMELGMLMKNGGFSNDFVTAEIINLAVKGLIGIKEKNDKILFFTSKDYEFSRKKNEAEEAKLNSSQKNILSDLFEKGELVKLSSLKNSFYKSVKEIEKDVKESLIGKNLITKTGGVLRVIFSVAGIFLMFISFPSGSSSFSFAASLFLSGLIIFIFSFVMPKRTLAGAELNWQIKGFKLFMETVDKNRAAFYEKENIFEKFLPYAIIFGITGLWIKKMKEIYGEEYFANYAPAWYVGSVAGFNADSFTSTMDSLSSSISSNTSAPSGSGGGGCWRRRWWRRRWRLVKFYQ